MRERNANDKMGGGSTVEADETFWGTEDNRRHDKKPRSGGAHKLKIFTLIDRDGKARSFHGADVKATTLRPILLEQLKRDTTLYTDKAGQHRRTK